MNGYTIFETDRQFYDVKMLRDSGLSNYKINKLVDDGKLIKLNNKVYQSTSYNGDESDFSVVSAYSPRGVFCMMTAARFYGLTTYLPDSVDIAIKRQDKISTLPDWPLVKIWYFPEARYSTGITQASDNCGTYNIYDVEKTVIDIIYYRNKIGIEETKEVLRNYLARQDRDLVKLHRYADSLKCGKILGTYLEVLL